MKLRFEPKASWLRWRGWPLLVLAASLGLTLGYWQHERGEEHRARLHAFDAAVRQASQQIEQHIVAHQHLLQGVQGFLAATPAADAQAFRRYVQALPLGADFAGLQGIALAPLVAGAHGDTAPVAQIEPAVPRNLAALGLDLLANPQILPALEQARDSGQMALSAQLDLRRLRLGRQAGFVLVAPIYGEGEPPATMAERRARLRAWVVAPVAAQELMAGLYGELPQGLELALYDGQDLRSAERLYRSAPLDEGDGMLAQAQEYLVMGGHTWTLTLLAGSAFARLHGADEAPVVLVAGVALAVLLALLARLLGTARERAQALAERMTQALRESEQRWAFALEGAGDGVWDWDLVSGRISSSMRWKSIMGLRPGQGDPDMSEVQAGMHPDDRPRVQAELRRCLDGLAPNFDSEYRIAKGSGWGWVLARGTVVERDAQQRPRRMIGTLSDINARRESEERVRFMALHDPLTELANRAHFDERLHFALASARRYNESIGLLLLDLNNFKPINDQHGHGVGDQLLQTVARRIKAAVRETDTVGRIGGDEFVVLLTGPVTRDSAQVVADKIFNQVALPMELGGMRIEVTCSIGLAIYPEDGLDEKSLNQQADAAMYDNKRAGRALLQDRHAAQPGDLQPGA